MTPQEDTGSSRIDRHLADAQAKAEAGNFADALATIRKAKALEPKNVYILAFERQAEQLQEFHTAGSLTDEQRSDILDSIPSIIEKALEVSHTSAGVTNVSDLGSLSIDPEQQRREKSVALEWLKNQYFQHAHEYIRKREYRHALAEIRRVYIIDPDNLVARALEREVEPLAQQAEAASPPLQMPPPVQSPRPDDRRTPPDSEPVVVITEEWSSPQRPHRGGAKPPAHLAAPRRKKKGNLLLWIFFALTLIVIAIAGLWFYQRAQHRKAAPGAEGLPPPSGEKFLGAPVRASEEQFFVAAPAESTKGASPPVRIAAEERSSSSTQTTEKKEGVQREGTKADRAKPSGGSPPSQLAAENPGTAEPSASGTPLQASTTPPEEQQPPAVKQEETGGPLTSLPVEKDAHIIKLQSPKFSSISYEMGIEGQIVVGVQIDAAGKPVDTVTMKCTNDLLIDPVLEAVRSSEYAPAEMAGGPVASWLTIPFKFAKKSN